VAEQRFTYRKHEKLKSRKVTDALFASGKTLQQFPLKLFYVVNDAETFSLNIGVGVSKRYFKKAVHRNRIKRLLREAFRLNKYLLYDTQLKKQLTVFILFTDKELPSQELMHTKIQALFVLLLKRIDGTA
jgi:ribonuclease P protein component